ncbi:MAG: YcxB family protein, partial [Agathobacter sp.]|nr:YcxB family protein [Agathobacter sp.]
YMPISLYLRSKAAFKKNKALANPLHFEFTEENIKVSQGEQSVELKWENVYKFVPSKNALLLYTNRVHAYILPKEQIGEQMSGLVQLAQKKLDGVRCRIK